MHLFKANITAGVKEKNNYNNIKNFAVEVFDQKTTVGLVSAINHPDLSAFKRAIETNAQRKVSIVKPQEIKSLSDYNVLILYQPNTSFKSIFDGAKAAGINTLVVTGMTTDFNFLNQQQNDLDFKVTNQKKISYRHSIQNSICLHWKI